MRFFNLFLVSCKKNIVKRALLDDTPLPMLAPELDNRVATALNYPGKVLADPDTNRLIISDTTNHRLVLTDLDNVDNFVIVGTGQAGFGDGTF